MTWLIAETYRSARQGVFRELKIYESSFRTALTEILWSMDMDKLSSLIQGIEEIPEIIDAARLCWSAGFLMRYADKVFFETRVRPVDPSLLDMFTFPLIHGNAATALDNMNSIVC